MPKKRIDSAVEVILASGKEVMVLGNWSYLEPTYVRVSHDLIMMVVNHGFHLMQEVNGVYKLLATIEIKEEDRSVSMRSATLKGSNFKMN